MAQSSGNLNLHHVSEMEEHSAKVPKIHQNGVSDDNPVEIAFFLRVKKLSDKAILPSRGYDLSRIYVGLPDLETRCKILKILLNKENLESGFSFEQLADATDGYSGSDLKNLCVAAAYRPLEEFLEQESKGEAPASDGVPALRPLNLNDFIHSKSKVRASVAEDASSIMKLREWEKKYGERES